MNFATEKDGNTRKKTINIFVKNTKQPKRRGVAINYIFKQKKTAEAVFFCLKLIVTQVASRVCEFKAEKMSLLLQVTFSNEEIANSRGELSYYLIKSIS